MRSPRRHLRMMVRAVGTLLLADKYRRMARHRAAEPELARTFRAVARSLLRLARAEIAASGLRL